MCGSHTILGYASPSTTAHIIPKWQAMGRYNCRANGINHFFTIQVGICYPLVRPRNRMDIMECVPNNLDQIQGSEIYLSYAWGLGGPGWCA